MNMFKPVTDIIDGVFTGQDKQGGDSMQQEQIDPEEQQRANYNRQLEEQTQQVKRDLRKAKTEMMNEPSKGSIQINDVEINLEDIDMKRLTKEERKDREQL